MVHLAAHAIILGDSYLLWKTIQKIRAYFYHEKLKKLLLKKHFESWLKRQEPFEAAMSATFSMTRSPAIVSTESIVNPCEKVSEAHVERKARAGFRRERVKT